MSRNALPEGTIIEKPAKVEGRNPTKYIKKDGEWVLIPQRPINIFGNGFLKTMKSKKISQQKIRPKSRYGF